VIVTEWKEFRSPDFDAHEASNAEAARWPIFDGRNIYDLRPGFKPAPKPARAGP
jgi:UDP-glucose 6-dehydrogenase